jgi:hypothetical protein
MSNTEAETGVCFFAYNNEKIDYIQLAHISAAYVKANQKNNSTCLITDNGTYQYLKDSIDPKLHIKCFDHVVISDVAHQSNPRRHFDSPWTEFSTQFSNSNKHDVFTLTPFEKTMLIDTDYFIMNNFYDYLFDTEIPIGMHKYARYMEHQPPYMNEQQLNEAGIHHWWSTVVYFDQSQESEVFFNTWSHVKDNWDYYHLLYQFPPGLFRTDFCVSIANHILNGFNENNIVHDFNGEPLVNMDQKDDIIEIKDMNDFIILSHNRKEAWKNILTRQTNQNLHLMNKLSLGRHAKTMIDMILAEDSQ